MPPKSKRPFSVWIAQIILGIYALGIALITLWGLYKGLSGGIQDPGLYLVTTVGILAFFGVFFGGVWGMAMRKPWGRWLGVAGLTILLIGAGVTQTSRWIAKSDSGSSFVSISFLLSVVVVAGMAFLVYRIAAGDAAEEFFNGKPTPDPEPFGKDSDAVV